MVAAVLIAAVAFVSSRSGRWITSLSQRRQGWARRYHITAFVGAIQGSPIAVDGMLLTAVFLGIAMPIPLRFIHQSGELERLARDSRQAASDSMRLADQLDGSPTKQDARATGPELHDAADRLASSAESLQRYAAVARVVGVVLLLFTLFVGLLAATYWQLQRQLAHAIARITLRFQGLASKRELIEFMAAESQVRDEASLRRFLDVAREIAERHGARFIVEPLNPWPERSPDTAGGAPPTPSA